MKEWQTLENHADENGHIPDAVYISHVSKFPICPEKDSEKLRMERNIWTTYLSRAPQNQKTNTMYGEMYRYEWYEGRKRTGFWGNLEDAVRSASALAAPRLTIFSSGSGRDLLKAGLAAGIFKSDAPKKIKGTFREIDISYFRLAKPGARIMLTEYDENNLAVLKNTVSQMIKAGLLSEEMVSIRRWNFREAAPLKTDSQDIVIFSLTGNYAEKEEQPLILNEIARCIRPGGFLVTSTMLPDFSFRESGSLVNKLRFVFLNPLAWPMAVDFFSWQANWRNMAEVMYEKGLWVNATAETWAEYLKKAGMDVVKIYPSPSRLVQVEVLLARKTNIS